MEQNTEIKLPKAVLEIIARLESACFPSYAVGGCVRDSLIGLLPSDWDIATTAPPESVIELFSDCVVIPTGLKHGTVTVAMGGTGYEITTFRSESSYIDGRHPDKVFWANDLEEDLKRRDFTINAMAYHPYKGVVDPFGGREDLRDRLIRAVGDPAERFKEDYLRILRAFRFAIRLSFSIEEATKAAAIAAVGNVKTLSAERVRSEFDMMLRFSQSDMFYEFLWEFCPFLFPCLEKCKGVLQQNPYHIHDVYEHSVKALKACLSDEIPVKLAVLLHDTGKPYVKTTDRDGIDHFYGHGKVSAEKAGKALEALRYDNKTADTVKRLVKLHGLPLALSEKSAKRLLNRLGTKDAKRLLLVKRADLAAQSEKGQSRLSAIDAFEDILDAVVRAGEAFSIKDLAVNGRDIMAHLGSGPSPEIGNALDFLLEAVMDGRCENAREQLLEYLDAYRKF